MNRKPLSSDTKDEPTDLLVFPRPSLAVDVAVLTVAPSAALDRDEIEPNRPLNLAVLLHRRTGATHPGKWGLPGAFVHERERLADAVLRTLGDKCGIEGLAPRQLHVFDDPNRDTRGWVISVAHVDVVPVDALSAALEAQDNLALAQVASPASTLAPTATAVLDIPGRQRTLPFDHDRIVTLAVDHLRDQYRAGPDPGRLLSEPFTLLELRRLHEAVLGERLQKDTFRRQMAPHLVEINELSDGTVGRPARLFQHRYDDRLTGAGK